MRRLGSSEVVSRAKLKSVRVMGVLVSGFIVCWTPYYVMSLWWWIDQAEIYPGQALIALVQLLQLAKQHDDPTNQ